MGDLICRASVMDTACNAVADAWEKKNVSVAGALIDAINSVPAAPDLLNAAIYAKSLLEAHGIAYNEVRLSDVIAKAQGR